MNQICLIPYNTKRVRCAIYEGNSAYQVTMTLRLVLEDKSEDVYVYNGMPVRKEQ